MSKEEKIENIRVEVTARPFIVTDRTVDSEIRACQDIVDQIHRHVDDVGAATIEMDTNYVCSHCGEPWTEESDEYNGGCCDADEANNPEANP